ncbi:MAG: Methyltransferase domain protein [Chlorobi bacterium OLB5]|nr:MAG: Methyltransferase domain protein [Chlorobi bacterium OLB5]
MFKKLLDNTNPNSLANKFRRKRFKLFMDFIKDFPRPVKILDAGGTVNYWEQVGIAGNEEFEITIVNLEIPQNMLYNNIILAKGDVTDLSMFRDKSFDIVFSNSVIEHIPTAEGRQRMADEIKRVGKSYFIQTPNYYFPFEPHFLLPLFQYYPKRFKIFLLTHFNIGWFKKCETMNEAIKIYLKTDY